MNITPTKAEPSERPRGRPAGQKSGELQERLLDIAEKLFAEQGFAATSVRQLADQASVNPSLVHYYFGSKQKLLYAVMDRAVEQLGRGLSSMRDSGPERITDLVSLMFRMAAEHQSMPPLVTREVLLSGGKTREVFTHDYAPRLGGALPGLIARAQAAGSISEDLDPGITALMVLSLCLFPFIARNVAEPVLGVDYSEEGLKKYMQQVNKLFSEGNSA